MLLVAERVFRDVDAEPLYLCSRRIALPLGSLSLIERYARPARRRLAADARASACSALVVAVTLLLATALDAGCPRTRA